MESLKGRATKKRAVSESSDLFANSDEADSEPSQVRQTIFLICKKINEFDIEKKFFVPTLKLTLLNSLQILLAIVDCKSKWTGDLNTRKQEAVG